MDEREWLTERFEQHRSHLRAVANRMLGSVAEADDALQEAWLRIRDEDPGSVENLQASLTTVVARVCLNMLRSRRVCRQRLSEVHVPDPVMVFSDQVGPDQEAVLADSVGLALLVVLDAMTPAERIAFVLHDVFGVPFGDVANALDRSEVAVQQLASRARRRVRDSPEPDRDLATQRRAVDAFFAASRDGDFEELMRVLDPEVVLTVDGGILRREASLTLRGADAVAAHTRTYARLHPFVVPAIINGTAGAVIAPHGRLYAVMAFTSSNGSVTRIDALLDPERLAQHTPPSRPTGSLRKDLVVDS
jgi:RNA polymerase sigma-70 factor (ECF subfamily)